MEGKPASLYSPLGGYDAIAAVVDDLLARLRSDELLARFWTSPRSVDTHTESVNWLWILLSQPQEDRHIISAGTGRLHIKEWILRRQITRLSCAAYLPHSARLKCLAERSEVVAFVTSLEPEIVEE